jgi:ankyrin repeat protein
MNQFEAAGAGNLQTLRSLLTPNNVDDMDERVYGCTTLHVAVMWAHDCVKLCLELGANVNLRAIDGWTSLHFVIDDKMGYQIARELLDAEAIIDAPIIDALDGGETTPLQRALENTRVEVAQLLLDRGAKISNLKLAVIPSWFTAFVASRSNCRGAAIIVIGIHKYHRTNITGNSDINVLRLVSKHVWSTRMDDVWGSK